MFTSYGQSRLIYGDTTAYGRLKCCWRTWNPPNMKPCSPMCGGGSNLECLPPEYRDLYALEPNVKENSGGCVIITRGCGCFHLPMGRYP